MMRSLYTGVMGIQSQQAKMDVIADNISNINTVAFKSSRASFKDVYNQTLKGASGTVGLSGNTNPFQVGLGSLLASIDKNMSQGMAQRTDNPTDVMIDGHGFFVVGDENGQYLTRAGNLQLDQQDALNINGFHVYGWDAVYNDTIKDYEIRQAAVAPIILTADKEIMQPQSTTRVDITGNLNLNESGVDGVDCAMTLYSSNGDKLTIPLIFNYDKESSSDTLTAWSYGIKPDASGNLVAYLDGDTSKPVKLGFSATQGDTNSWRPLGWLGFDTNGKASIFGTGQNTLRPPQNAEKDHIQLELFVNVPEGSDYAATFGNSGSGSVILDFTELTQYGNEASHPSALPADGYASGKRTEIKIDEDGKIFGIYSNDRTRVLAQIPVAKVANPEGLSKYGNFRYVTTPNSGEYNEIGEVGKIRSGALESSNVDLAEEFAQMVSTHRGFFQTNSRVISTSNEMLQTAIGMKR